MSILEIGNMRLGEGLPKICIPVMGTTTEELIAEAQQAMQQPCQLIEWRADFMIQENAGLSIQEVCGVLRKNLAYLRLELNVPLLFTIRTAKEGGQADISADDYFDVNRMVAESGMADIIDIEAFDADSKPDENVQDFIAYAHEMNVKVLLSNHDFEKTPDLDVMVKKYTDMQQMGGDIMKLAVMPQQQEDVLRLLEAAETVGGKESQLPLVAISMGELGMTSRICAGQFGSVITFASGREASAPGQVNAKTLQGYLERYYK